MNSGNRDRQSASRGRRWGAMLILLVLCFQMIAAPAAAAESPDYGGMTLREHKQARVCRGTLDSVYTLSTWEFAEQEDVPYVSLKEYLNLLFVETYDPALDFAWDGEVLLVTRNGVSLRVDTAQQSVSVDDMSAFLGPNASGALADGIVEKRSSSRSAPPKRPTPARRRPSDTK